MKMFENRLTPQLEVILSIISYSLCSGTLVLINKLILHMLPYPSLVVSLQVVAAIAFIWGSAFLGFMEVDPLRWKFILPYLAYTVAFSFGMYCNMKSLQFSNVETVIIFRALAPCIVSILDVMFLGREYPTTRSWIGLSLIVLGAYGYAIKDPQFQSQGTSAYFWPTIYCAVISFEMAYGKKLVKSVDMKTHSGPVLYTNLLGFPPLLLFAHMGDEYQRFWQDFWFREESRFPQGAIALLILGCVVGTAIGYSSWWCRAKVSATSFTLIGVMNKCMTVLLNMLIWDNHAPPSGIAALFLCLVGGTLYQQAPMRSTGATTTTPTGTNSATKKNLRSDLIPKDDDVWSEEVGAKESMDEEMEILQLETGAKRKD